MLGHISNEFEALVYTLHDFFSYGFKYIIVKALLTWFSSGYGRAVMAHQMQTI